MKLQLDGNTGSLTVPWPIDRPLTQEECEAIRAACALILEMATHRDLAEDPAPMDWGTTWDRQERFSAEQVEYLRRVGVRVEDRGDGQWIHNVRAARLRQIVADVADVAAASSPEER